jgi:hypothetical protein
MKFRLPADGSKGAGLRQKPSSKLIDFVDEVVPYFVLRVPLDPASENGRWVDLDPDFHEHRPQSSEVAIELGEGWIRRWLLVCGVKRADWAALSSEQRQALKRYVTALETMKEAVQAFALPCRSEPVRGRAAEFLERLALIVRNDRPNTKGFTRSWARRVRRDAAKLVLIALTLSLAKSKKAAQASPGRRGVWGDRQWLSKEAERVLIEVSEFGFIGSADKATHVEIRPTDIQELRAESPGAVAKRIICRAFPDVTEDDLKRKGSRTRKNGRQLENEGWPTPVFDRRAIKLMMTVRSWELPPNVIPR